MHRDLRDHGVAQDLEEAACRDVGRLLAGGPVRLLLRGRRVRRIRNARIALRVRVAAHARQAPEGVEEELLLHLKPLSLLVRLPADILRTKAVLVDLGGFVFVDAGWTQVLVFALPRVGKTQGQDPTVLLLLALSTRRAALDHPRQTCLDADGAGETPPEHVVREHAGVLLCRACDQALARAAVPERIGGVNGHHWSLLRAILRAAIRVHSGDLDVVQVLATGVNNTSASANPWAAATNLALQPDNLHVLDLQLGAEVVGALLLVPEPLQQGVDSAGCLEVPGPLLLE
mmetsp:Transcript_67368/g.194842  ORF Transcript_67368/g.194842 Transcript_67368/m.194842 type:complete len:288 (+) Transcript_67368:538-1401(+)